MSQSFSLAFRLDKRVGDEVHELARPIPNRIHMHDTRAGVSISCRVFVSISGLVTFSVPEK